MNRARRAFERFEKSDSWLPFVLLSCLGIGGTVGVVSLATDLGRSNLQVASGLLYSSGQMLGSTVLPRISKNQLQERDLAQVDLEGLQDWGQDFDLVAAFDWDARYDTLWNSIQDETRSPNAAQVEAVLKADSRFLCWLSRDKRSLLVTILAQDLLPDGEQGWQFSSAQIISVEQEINQHFITAQLEPAPPAPWESIVSLGRLNDTDPKELIAEHAEHTSGKSLKEFSSDRLADFLVDSNRNKVDWLIARGGLTSGELKSIVPSSDSLKSETLKTAMELGLLAGQSQQASQYILDRWESAGSREDLIVVHPCSHYIDLHRSALSLAAADFGDVLDGDADFADYLKDAILMGPSLETRTREIVERIETESFATLVHEMDKPFPAKIYRLTEKQETSDD